MGSALVTCLSCLMLLSSFQRGSGRELRSLGFAASPGWGFMSLTEKTLQKHLDELTEYGTNNRVPCTPGNTLARHYIASQLASFGVLPAGAVSGSSSTIDGQNSFFHVVPESINPQHCPEGIANVVGVVPGSDLAHEYVLVQAHYDGTREPLDGLQVFDDATGVAAGLFIASRVAFQPQRRSVVFVFSDAEQGWANVGEDAPTWSCAAKNEPQWVVNIARGCGLEQGKYPIGMVSWLDDTRRGVHLDAMKVALVADSLGALRLGLSDAVAVVGADAAPGLPEYLATWWSKVGPALTFMPEQPVVAAKSGLPAASTFCDSMGSSGCLKNAKIPTAWISQPGASIVTRALENGDIPTFAEGVDLGRLASVTESLLGLEIHLARDDLQGIAISPTRGTAPPELTLEDAMNICDGLQQLAMMAYYSGDTSMVDIAVQWRLGLMQKIVEPMYGQAPSSVADNQMLLQAGGAALAVLWIG